MLVKDLDLRELLSFKSKGGVMHFGGQRVLLLDAVALGLLRKELIETLGIASARGILTRFGYAHGWRTAEDLRTAFPWENPSEWKWAGGRIHMLHGMVVFDTATFAGEEPAALAESICKESYEAEQHLLHLGQADEPVCWTIAGFASGYLSFTHGREVYGIEESCQGKGDSRCHFVFRFKEEWGDRIAPYLTYYQREYVNDALKDLTEALREAERRLKARQRQIARLEGRKESPSGTVARSAGMRKVLDLAQRVAKVDSVTVITGESGVGKERIAQLIHDESERAGRPFVAVNCGAVTETLLESELFGHAKGAFTGAERDRVGLFEAADGGTIFLDEIGELALNMQVKLLRVLQEKKVRRVGENTSRDVDVRVVAATNRHLADEVKAGRFRQDLYYRLRVIELRIPPLRERGDDILPLARVFLDETSRRMGRKVTGFTPRAADQLLRHDWPGNVRELQNAVEHAVALCTGTRVDIEDLPEELRVVLPRATIGGRIRPLAEVEREYILAALEAAGGNKTRAAAELQVGITTVFRKLKQYEYDAASKSEGVDP